jgi:hypothetical protein
MQIMQALLSPPEGVEASQTSGFFAFFFVLGKSFCQHKDDCPAEAAVGRTPRAPTPRFLVPSLSGGRCLRTDGACRVTVPEELALVPRALARGLFPAAGSQGRKKIPREVLTTEAQSTRRQRLTRDRSCC